MTSVAHPRSSSIRLQMYDWPTVVGLSAVVAVAIWLRLYPIVIFPSINWWDEIFQATEQAHRLIYGYGLVPWEFQLGARSWLLPGVVTGLMEIARAIGDGPAYYLPVIATAFAALAAAPVICCFLWCRQWFGVTAALVAALVVATDPQLVYFGGRTLSEVIATHLLVIAIYLVWQGHRIESRRLIMLAGIMFGLTGLLRIQLAPTVSFLLVWAAWNDWRRWAPSLTIGVASVLLLGGALDWATLGYPFASVWHYVVYNEIYNVSAGFGTEPWYYYALGEFGLLGPAFGLVAIAVALGARRMPVLLVAAAITLVVHSAIAHKEYRFIYPMILLLTMLASIGFAQLASWGAQALRGRKVPPNAAITASAGLSVALWAMASFHVWTDTTMTELRARVHDNLSAANFVADMPAICGLGLYGEKGRDWARYGGYTVLHRPVPLFWPEDERELRAQTAGFNFLLYTAVPPPELGFETTRCFGKTCIAQRPGECAALPPPAMPFPDPLAGMAPPASAFPAIQPRAASSRP